MIFKQIYWVLTGNTNSGDCRLGVNGNEEALQGRASPTDAV